MEAAEREKEADRDLGEAISDAQALSDQLRAEGLAEDAAEVERITGVVEDVAAGRVKGEELDKAIEDTKAEIARLRAAGKDKAAAELQHILEKEEEARNGRAKAKALGREAALLSAEEDAV